MGCLLSHNHGHVSDILKDQQQQNSNKKVTLGSFVVKNDQFMTINRKYDQKKRELFDVFNLLVVQTTM